jgi:hypothetical protein
MTKLKNQKITQNKLKVQSQIPEISSLGNSVVLNKKREILTRKKEQKAPLEMIRGKPTCLNLA